MTNIKICSKCRAEKPYSEFERDKTKKDGHKSQCKPCRYEYRREYEKTRNAPWRKPYMAKRLETTRQKIRRIKESSPCTDCKTHYPYYVMQFDHIGTDIKSFEISNYGTRSWETIEREIAKCELVCANCHAARSWHRSKGLDATA